MADSHSLAERYKTVVEETLGVIARVDHEGDVSFKHPDFGGFFFRIDAVNDPEYMMLVYPKFFNCMTGVSKSEVLEICNSINRRCKGAKLSVMDDAEGSVIATVEMVVAGPDQMPDAGYLTCIVKRAMSMLTNAVRAFSEQVRPMLEIERLESALPHA